MHRTIMDDVNVNLNVHELGIIISALQLLELSEEKLIAREYGSTSALYYKMIQLMDKMDTSQTGIRQFEEASF